MAGPAFSYAMLYNLMGVAELERIFPALAPAHLAA